MEHQGRNIKRERYLMHMISDTNGWMLPLLNGVTTTNAATLQQ